MEVRCKQRCFSSVRGRRYWPGDVDDIDPLEPIAKYFVFPPGTEVYTKEPAGAGSRPKVGTMTVPGQMVATEPPKPPDWDPIIEEVQQRYGGKKTNIIKALCEEREIDIESMTISEAHQALIDFEL